MRDIVHKQLGYRVVDRYINYPIFFGSRGFLLRVGDSKCFYTKYGIIHVITDSIFDKRPFFCILKDNIFTSLVL